MPTYPTIAAGQKLTASLLQSMLDNVIVKGTTQTITNSTTLVTDTELQVPVVANASYEIEFNLRYAGLLAAGFKTCWVYPSGASGNKWVMGPGSANVASTDADTTEMRWSIHGAGTVVNYSEPRNSTSLQTFCWERGRVDVGSTAGTVLIQYAQKTANATGTQVVPASYVRYRRVA